MAPVEDVSRRGLKGYSRSEAGSRQQVKGTQGWRGGWVRETRPRPADPGRTPLPYPGEGGQPLQPRQRSRR